MKNINLKLIKEYCREISDLCNEITHGFENGKYIASFGITCFGWEIDVRENSIGYKSLYKVRLTNMYLDTAANGGVGETYFTAATWENFEDAIAKLQGYLKEVQS